MRSRRGAALAKAPASHTPHEAVVAHARACLRNSEHEAKKEARITLSASKDENFCKPHKWLPKHDHLIYNVFFPLSIHHGIASPPFKWAVSPEPSCGKKNGDSRKSEVQRKERPTKPLLSRCLITPDSPTSADGWYQLLGLPTTNDPLILGSNLGARIAF